MTKQRIVIKHLYVRAIATTSLRNEPNETSLTVLFAFLAQSHFVFPDTCT